MLGHAVAAARHRYGAELGLLKPRANVCRAWSGSSEEDLFGFRFDQAARTSETTRWRLRRPEGVLTGCRVLERLLEHCPTEQTAPLVEEAPGCVALRGIAWLDGVAPPCPRQVLAGAPQLCRHTFGNFVVQHVLEHGLLASLWASPREQSELL